MSNVVDLPVLTRLNRDPAKALEQAISADLEGIVVCGFTKRGDFFRTTSYADGGDVLWLLELLKRDLMARAFEEE